MVDGKLENLQLKKKKISLRGMERLDSEDQVRIMNNNIHKSLSTL